MPPLRISLKCFCIFLDFLSLRLGNHGLLKRIPKLIPHFIAVWNYARNKIAVMPSKFVFFLYSLAYYYTSTNGHVWCTLLAMRWRWNLLYNTRSLISPETRPTISASVGARLQRERADYECERRQARSVSRQFDGYVMKCPETLTWGATGHRGAWGCLQLTGPPVEPTPEVALWVENR